MKRILILAVALTLLTAGSPVFAGEDSQAGYPVPQRYEGRMAALSGPGAGGTAYMTFHVDRYATDSEVQALAQILGEQGEEALLKSITALDPGGWIKVGNGLRYNFRVVRAMQTPEGQMLVGITDRPIQFGEVVRGTRSRQYTFGWVQILFDENGKGEGGLIPTAKIEFDEENRLVVESFGLQPYKILAVKPIKVKGK